VSDGFKSSQINEAQVTQQSSEIVVTLVGRELAEIIGTLTLEILAISAVLELAVSYLLNAQSLELSEVVRIEAEGIPEIAKAHPYPGVPSIMGRGVQDDG
jgi:hypothetical protein